jgi:dephospho-CoA kinase
VIVGLTGLSCAGKNYIAARLAARGFPTLDADVVAHEALEAKAEAVIERFGEGVRGADGEIDRVALGRVVFGNDAERADLEAILYPSINNTIAQWTTTHANNICFVNAAVLHKAAIFADLDALVIVHAPFISRLRRARLRDKRPLIDIIHRFNSQQAFLHNYRSKVSKKCADTFDIYNVGGGPLGCLFRAYVERQLTRMFERLAQRQTGESQGKV